MVHRLGRAEVRDLLEHHGLVPARALGQNFVVDPNTVERIARLSGLGPGDTVIEIGAGLGSLTLALAGTGASVIAVEIDDRLIELLSSIVPGVRVVHADAMRLDYDELVGDLAPDAPLSLVANLPYNIATPLVLRLLESVPRLRRLLVMVQREVGERFAAPVGTKAYGAVTVRIAYFATARLLGVVSPEVFLPRPHIDSVLVELARRPEPLVPAETASYAEISRLCRAGFAGRRKMLRRSLAGLVPLEVFAAAGIDSAKRAEELDVAEWGKLAACLRSSTSSPTPS